MKTFKLDQYGDVVIKDNQIELVEGLDLVVQTLKQVLGTNLGEWFGDEDEGIDFYAILTKNPNYDLVHDTIETAVQKVADSLEIELETDNFTYDVNGRNLTIAFTLTMNGAESTSIEVTL